MSASPSENRPPVRVANCSGYHGMGSTEIKPTGLTYKGDPAYEMYRQATLGDVDFITGDYLAGRLLGIKERDTKD